MRYEKSCGAVVFRREKRPHGKEQGYVLMIKHRDGGHLSFPKGHVEFGEEEKATAIREVYEETHVRIYIGEKFRYSVHYSPKPGTEKEVVYFLAYTTQIETSPRMGEIAQVEWVPIEQAQDALMHENDKAVLQGALDYMEFNNQYKKVRENINNK